MAPRPVCRLDELDEGIPTPTLVGDRRVALVRWRGNVFACRDVCPHQSTSFRHGRVLSPIQGTDPREIAIEDDRPVLTCPWHKFEFELQTGRCISDPYFRIRVYHASVADGVVYVDLG
jgi:3-phenylpropionate/trans-cinnamate dioxygenase ferredoxin subunit